MLKSQTKVSPCYGIDAIQDSQSRMRPDNVQNGNGNALTEGAARTIESVSCA